MGDAIGQLFQGLLDLLAPIIMPDWGELVGLLPVFLLVGVVGPILTLLVLGWALYVLFRPRDRIAYTEPEPTAARIVDGAPAYPAGEPYCAFDRLVYPPGATECRRCGRDLAVICPKCGTGRPAHLDTCGTCGLVLRINPRAVAPPRAAPPPGGAAIA
ncbi:MAG: hypothetical protein FIA92_02575 [Chloroflexi bacterium]|nr:hypothetical protein [Chloroflexota bacterium]